MVGETQGVFATPISIVLDDRVLVTVDEDTVCIDLTWNGLDLKFELDPVDLMASGHLEEMTLFLSSRLRVTVAEHHGSGNIEGT